MNLTRYALYLHDYGSQIGPRLAIKAPDRVAALIIQNGDIYEKEGTGLRQSPRRIACITSTVSSTR